MRSGIIILILLECILSPPLFGKSTQYKGGEELKAEARRGLEEILELWRGERYDDLYNRTKGKGSRETFVDTLSRSDRRPSCCWDRLQQVDVKVKDDSRAMVRATFGIEVAGGDVEYTTRPLDLIKEEGLWKVSQGEIISLAGGTKKKKRR